MLSDMASLEMKLTLDFGEQVSINLPDCLADEEVVSLLEALEAKLAHHLPADVTSKIKLLTGPTSCLLPPVKKDPATSSMVSGTSSIGSCSTASATSGAKKPSAGAVQVQYIT